MRLLTSVLAITLTACHANAQETILSPRVDSTFVPADTSQIDLNRFAASLVADARTGYDRAERLLSWLSRNFRWLSTDYRKRTVKEIIVRRGGNCFELASVYMGLVRTLGIRYRQVAEINIQPLSERRQQSAADLVAARGDSYSVFGRQHNDHRWVEIFDERTDSWIPADPSVGVIGLDAWLKSRVWFGERRAIDTSITNDMIVPIAIFITEGPQKIVDDRTRFYLVENLDRLYDGVLSKLPSWTAWHLKLDALRDRCRGAFEGRVNLHESAADISDLATVYAKLRQEYQNELKHQSGQRSENP